ncbi:MAG: hypothetical protein JSR85_07815 [Proteobacteria bacterium]|nr:hypothetical protein [Pseudomonadota bacterium]
MLVFDKNMKQNKSVKLVAFTAALLIAASFQAPAHAIENDFDMVFVKGGAVPAPKINDRNISKELEGKNHVKHQVHSSYLGQNDPQPEGRQRIKGFLQELKEEKKNLKLMKRGKLARKVGEYAGKAEHYLDMAAPVVAGINVIAPVAAPYVDPMYAASKFVLKGAHKILPIIGDKVELHYAKNLSQRSYVTKQMSDEERNVLIIQNARYQIEKLEVQLGALIAESKKSFRKTKNRELINEKTMKLSSYYDILKQY